MKSQKPCKHCEGEGRWEVPTISTHDIYQYCDYCNGAGIENLELAEKIKKQKEYKWTPSVYEMLDEEGIMIC